MVTRMGHILCANNFLRTVAFMGHLTAHLIPIVRQKSLSYNHTCRRSYARSDLSRMAWLTNGRSANCIEFALRIASINFVRRISVRVPHHFLIGPHRSSKSDRSSWNQRLIWLFDSQSGKRGRNKARCFRVNPHVKSRDLARVSSAGFGVLLRFVVLLLLFLEV